jgi:RNA polymerase sigma factor (TIGR02999 family)
MPDLNDSLPELLARADRGDETASKQLMELVYGELRALAGSYARGQHAGHTLQPTALVHEAFLKLADQPLESWESRAHFFAVAAKAMRQVLTDHARARAAGKRGGEGWERVTLGDRAITADGGEVDLIALDEALTELARYDERKHRVVELRFFGALTVEETARVLGLSTTTIESEWRAARAWLAMKLGG